MRALLNRIFVVFRKEVMDNLRDRRSIFSALASSLVGPLILILMVFVLGKSIFRDRLLIPFDLPVIGAENAPELIQFMEQNGAQIRSAPADPQAAVRNGDADVVLIIPEGFREDFSRGRPATVQMVLDSTRQSTISSIQRLRDLLNTYNQQIAVLRLIARGINPVMITPLAVEDIDLATPQTQALIFLNMMPYFIVLVVFLGGMYVVIDTTAGERERGSLEPLLINPVARWEFVIGKLAASWPFAILTLLINLLAFAVAFNAFPLEDYIGIQLSIDLVALGWIFIIALPMILLASALQMIIATFTRSFKEAQTYVAFLPLIPALPGIGLAFLPVKATLWTMMIPTFGQQLLINQLMRDEPVSLINAVVSALVTIFLSLSLIFIAIRLYQRERLLFGTK
jgi:sodium transport system permease protein